MDIHKKERNNAEFSNSGYEPLLTRYDENSRQKKLLIISLAILGGVCILLLYLLGRSENRNINEFDDLNKPRGTDYSADSKGENVGDSIEHENDILDDKINKPKEFDKKIINLLEIFRTELKKLALQISKFKEFQNEPIIPIFNDLYLNLITTFENDIYLGKIYISIVARENIRNEIELDFEVNSGSFEGRDINVERKIFIYRRVYKRSRI